MLFDCWTIYTCRRKALAKIMLQPVMFDSLTPSLVDKVAAYLYCGLESNDIVYKIIPHNEHSVQILP